MSGRRCLWCTRGVVCFVCLVKYGGNHLWSDHYFHWHHDPLQVEEGPFQRYRYDAVRSRLDNSGHLDNYDGDFEAMTVKFDIYQIADALLDALGTAGLNLKSEVEREEKLEQDQSRTSIS